MPLLALLRRIDASLGAKMRSEFAGNQKRLRIQANGQM